MAIPPSKPYPDFPLFAHTVGQWAKSIRGKTYYFGTWADPTAALNKFLTVRDYLYAGRRPPTEIDGTVITLDYLVNRFLAAKRDAVSLGEIESRTYEDYKAVCIRLLKILDRNLAVDSLLPSDFEKLKRELSRTRGPVSLTNDITRIRTVLKFGGPDGLRITQSTNYGGMFKKPNRRALRKAKREKGPMMLEAFEIKLLLSTACDWLKAMIYLGINCGFGNNDCAKLPISALDFEQCWHGFQRPKTEVERRCPLWPETIQAIRVVIESRQCEKNVNVFLTSTGRMFDHTIIGKAFRKLARDHDIYRKGIGFYALRHTFQTIGEVKGEIATKYIMGHAPPAEDMSSVYREHISDGRLRSVTDYVRRWMLSDAATKIMGFVTMLLMQDYANDGVINFCYF